MWQFRHLDKVWDSLDKAILATVIRWYDLEFPDNIQRAADLCEQEH